jgi:helicase domain protein
MEQVEVKYTPGMRIIVRGEEWMVKKVETNSLGNQTLHVMVLSPLVKDYDSMFLVDVEDDIEIVDPAKVTLVPDDSAFFRKSKVYIESQWRGKIPTDNKIHIGDKAAMDLMPYQLEPAQMALNNTRQRMLIADTVGLGKTLEAGFLCLSLLLVAREREFL